MTRNDSPNAKYLFALAACSLRSQHTFLPLHLISVAYGFNGVNQVAEKRQKRSRTEHYLQHLSVSPACSERACEHDKESRHKRTLLQLYLLLVMLERVTTLEYTEAPRKMIAKEASTFLDESVVRMPTCALPPH